MFLNKKRTRKNLINVNFFKKIIKQSNILNITDLIQKITNYQTTVFFLNFSKQKRATCEISETQFWIKSVDFTAKLKELKV